MIERKFHHHIELELGDYYYYVYVLCQPKVHAKIGYGWKKLLLSLCENGKNKSKLLTEMVMSLASFVIFM